MNDIAKNEGRILVLEPDETLNASIMSALREAAPEAVVDIAHSIEDAQEKVLHDRPDLFVLDMDAAKDLSQDFLLDMRTSHPNARAIILTAVHLASQREQAAGIGAIHFLEKPFPHSDFVDLVQALLRSGAEDEGEKFQGTLSDLHLSDIIQLKCMSGATSALEFTGPQGEKARIFFDHGQVWDANAPGKKGVEAFNEIVSWKGGKISEVHGAELPPRSIDIDWQFLLMEAVRKIDETTARRERRKRVSPSQRQKILVIDDSMMLLSFVQEILAEANYDVVTAANAEEGLQASRDQHPDLILLDYVLPDLKGDEVSRRLAADEGTAGIPVLYMSGFGADLKNASTDAPNVIGFVSKPFTSDLLIKAVEEHLPKVAGTEAPEEQPEPEAEMTPEFANVVQQEMEPTAASPSAFSAPIWNEPAHGVFDPGYKVAQPENVDLAPIPTSNAYFSGDTNFLSLNWALRTTEKENLTGVLRCFWDKANVDLYARDGKVVLVTTADADLYCSEAPITLVSVDPARVEAARARQAQDAMPLFLTLANENVILRDPAVQLVHHYGQKLFAELWAAPRVRFVFQQAAGLPVFTEGIEAEEVDHWLLNTLRMVQYPDIAEKVAYDPNWIPAFTRDGIERVQKLRLTVAEAQFASQFNGERSLAQIARNLRLDLKFARLTLFRFLALEIVECWPPAPAEKKERGGGLRRLIGLGS